MGLFHYGTSSFSDSAWVGPFYPAGTRPADFLTFYATQFDAVEVDSTYYGIPAPAMVDGWERKTPPGFRMSAKFPRSIVHCGEGPRPDPTRVLVASAVEKDTQEFLANIGRLGEKCGPLVLQFPYFNRDAFAAPGPFLERLDAYLEGLPEHFQYAVEIRNKAWLAEPLLEILRRHHAALVLSDIAYMPHPASLARRMDVFTTDFVFVRLIGDRKATEAATKKFDRIVLDKRKSLMGWAEFLRPVIARASETWAFANNHYAGHGPATIRELAELIQGE